jgi:hypothetical protein
MTRRAHSASTVEHARVLQELELVRKGRGRTSSQIEEQLRQCPEAFKVGEIIGKVCERVKYDRQSTSRLLPPAGTIVPPIA